ncbi:RNA polymerase sigma factor [Nocardia higoensis]|uniref:RNA polymerase sigma factor n=1 Tax=Nocardia higoensis TaxID=228599 RepID=UPI001E28E6B5|nr:RNA polymerase sigma factor [Nocardia higoensis]
MARGDRPAVSTGTVRRTVEAVWRGESARIVGGLARYTGDFELAEDLAQEALAEALVSWSVDGVPREPISWLLTVGRRRAVDGFRRRASLDVKYAELARNLDESVENELFDPERIDDDVLALMFVACHPVLGKEARIAVTLRVVGGLTSQEIARSFFVPVSTVQARITRAKKALTAAGVRFEVPDARQRRERLGSVLQVIYLIFTEGSSASGGEAWLRTELAGEALRLGRVLSRLAPEPEVFGLLALMELTAARFPARLDGEGRPVLLEDQDRTRWDRAAIRRGLAALQRASSERGLGPYAAQADIAACHARAASVEETDWARIVAVYDALVRATPSPVLELNRAVAVAMLSGPEAALALIDGIELPGSHLVPAVRGELLARSGRGEQARVEYLEAARLCGNAAQRTVLEEKAAALQG